MLVYRLLQRYGICRPPQNAGMKNWRIDRSKSRLLPTAGEPQHGGTYVERIESDSGGQSEGGLSADERAPTQEAQPLENEAVKGGGDGNAELTTEAESFRSDPPVESEKPPAAIAADEHPVAVPSNPLSHSDDPSPAPDASPAEPMAGAANGPEDEPDWTAVAGYLNSPPAVSEDMAPPRSRVLVYTTGAAEGDGSSTGKAGPEPVPHAHARRAAPAPGLLATKRLAGEGLRGPGRNLEAHLICLEEGLHAARAGGTDGTEAGGQRGKSAARADQADDRDAQAGQPGLGLRADQRHAGPRPRLAGQPVGRGPGSA